MEGWIAFGAAVLTNALIYGLLALGLNLHFGYAGLLNFGHVAFFAAGAFSSALLTLPPPGSADYAGSYEIGLGLPFGAGLAAAGLAGGLLALLVGATSVRLGGHYLAIVTFALAEIFAIFLSNEEWLTRGEYGISTVPQPLRGMAPSASGYLLVFLAVAALVVAACYWLVRRLTRSPFGRTLRGLREDEEAARSLGKDTPRLKLKAFVVGGVLAGVAGSLWVHSIGAVHVGQFVPIVTFNVWLAMLLGGVGNNAGVLLGALMLVVLRESTRFLGAVPLLNEAARGNPTLLPSLRFILIGLALVLVVRFAPDGVLPERLRTRTRTHQREAMTGQEAELESAGFSVDAPGHDRIGGLLDVEGVRRSFGGVQAVRDATFQVPAGSITGLIGPNGAGKTTTFDLIAGRLAPDGGRVRLRGHDITGLAPNRVADRGLGRTFQIPRTFRRMTVWENLMVAAGAQPGEGFWRGLLGGGAVARREAEIAAKADDVLAFLEIEQVVDLPAGALSGGQRKLLELGRVLMRDPEMIMLDEPTAGVAPALTEKLIERLRALRAAGATLMVVEHDLDLVMRLVDHLVVMHLGAVLVEGPPAVVRHDPRVLESYLGGVDA